MERFAVVDLVKLAHRAAPGITYPSCHRPYLTLRQKLYTVTPARSGRHFGFPVSRVAHIRCSFFVFDQVQRAFVIAFHAQLHLPEHVITDTSCHLHGSHRRQIMRHRHPHIARQRERTVAQQMHILAHVGITGLDRYIFVHQKTHSYSRLDRRIHLAADTVHTEPCAVVQPEPTDRTPCVFDISRHFVSVQCLVADRGVHIECRCG